MATILELIEELINQYINDRVGLSNVTNDAQLKRADNDWQGFTEEPAPSNTDVLLLEKGITGAKRKVLIGNLPTGSSGSDYLSIGTAGENLAAYTLCYLKSDGKLWKACASQEATMPGLVLAVSEINANQSGPFIRRGIVSNVNWSWTIIGGYVYAATTPGALTQTLLSGSGEQVQIVGIALSATHIDFDPQLLLVEVQ